MLKNNSFEFILKIKPIICNIIKAKIPNGAVKVIKDMIHHIEFREESLYII
jgi:hypothetical protein